MMKGNKTMWEDKGRVSKQTEDDKDSEFDVKVESKLQVPLGQRKGESITSVYTCVEGKE